MSFGGHADFESYLELLEHMDTENMKDWERRMMSEVAELRLIQDDIFALKTHLRERRADIQVPHWIMDPQIRAEAHARLTFNVKYRTVDINSTKLIPTPAQRGPGFEERLRA